MHVAVDLPSERTATCHKIEETTHIQSTMCGPDGRPKESDAVESLERPDEQKLTTLAYRRANLDLVVLRYCGGEFIDRLIVEKGAYYWNGLQAVVFL